MTLRASLFLAALLSACRIEPAGGPPFQGSAGDGASSSEIPPENTGGGGSGGTLGSGGRSSPKGGEGGADEPPPTACDGQEVELDEVRSGLVLSSVTVALEATATSQKFLVSETEAGSCLWGGFFGEPAEDGEPRGLFVISYGDEAPGDARCQAGTDALPDDLAPGDVVRIVGRASHFAPSACPDVTPAVQLVADARCRLERIARETPLGPVPLPLDVADALSGDEDPELTRRWLGGLVRLENVSALPNDAGDGAVRPYGVLALAETALEIHADVEYGDLSAGGPRDASKSLDFPYPTEFRSITGLVTLDYCTVALAPRKRCSDFDPPSASCP